MVLKKQRSLKKIFSKVLGRKSSILSKSRIETVPFEEETFHEEDRNEDINELEVQRVNTMHADLTIPEGVRSGEELVIQHDGLKTIKVPKGQQGKRIRIKMISGRQFPSTRMLRGACLLRAKRTCPAERPVRSWIHREGDVPCECDE
eukprot:61436_1